MSEPRGKATSWEEQYVDCHIERAWLELRMQIADRLTAGVSGGEMEPIEISTATGENLTVEIDDDRWVLVVVGDETFSTMNVDEAAYIVFQVLHDDWQVIHPAFLDCELVDVPCLEDNTCEVTVPVLGRAESKEQLQDWVVASFSEGRDDPLEVDPNGDVRWRTRGGNTVTVKVRNAGRIEFLTVLGRQVGLKRARRAIDRLSRSYFGLKFLLVQDTLVMSQIVIAHPFSTEQLDAALRRFMADTDDLAWVADKVLRKRVRVERAALADAQEAKDEAEAARAVAEAAAAEAEREAAKADQAADRYWQQLRTTERRLKAAIADRDAARAELARINRHLIRALGDRELPLSTEGGGAP